MTTQQEETMTEKKQIDEKEIRHLYFHGNGESNLGVDTFVYNLKKSGYIRESAVEEAEEKFYKIKDWSMSAEYKDALESLFYAIQALKSEMPEIEQKIKKAEQWYKESEEKNLMSWDLVVEFFNLIQLLKPYYYKSKEGSK